MKKRNSRAISVLDFDDLEFLKLIKDGKKKPISKVRDKLEISHTGFLVHRNRLEKFGLIQCFRGEKDYRNKYLKIKSNGLFIIQIFQDINIFNNYAFQSVSDKGKKGRDK